MGTDIKKSHSEPDLCKFNALETKESNEQLSGSPSSSRSSDPCDNILKYIEDMLNYKPKNKGIDKLQKLKEKLYQQSLANAVLTSETESKSTEIKSKTSNINIVITSESGDVSPYCDPVHTDNYFTTPETEVKELSATAGTLKSYEIFNQNITKPDFGNTSMKCEQIITDIKTGLSVASDNEPMDYKVKSKNVHEEQTSNFTSPSCLSSETMSTDGEAISPGNPNLNEMLNQNNKKCSHNFVKPLVNSQPSTPDIKTSPYAVKKSPVTSVTKTPNKSNKYHYIESPVAAYIHNCPLVPLVRDVSAKKELPNTSRQLKEVTGVKSIKPNKKYHYIQSPVAAYINNSPQVPLVKAVDPKKELPSTSRTLPQITVSKAIESSDKENINLPLVAHKSSKETTVMEIPDKNKLP